MSEEEERSTERVKTLILAALGASTAEPIGVVYETSYLNITLFLLIINLDYSRHLKRASTPQTKKGEKIQKKRGKKDFIPSTQ